MSGKIDDGEGILGDLMEFCSSDEFQVMAEKFCIENCHHFTEEEEHRLEYTYLHADFSSLFESHIQKFIDERGVSDREFYKLLRRAQENNDKSAEFIEVFLASCEYDSFVHLMRFMIQKKSLTLFCLFRDLQNVSSARILTGRAACRRPCSTSSSSRCAR